MPITQERIAALVECAKANVAARKTIREMCDHLTRDLRESKCTFEDAFMVLSRTIESASPPDHHATVLGTEIAHLKLTLSRNTRRRLNFQRTHGITPLHESSYALGGGRQYAPHKSLPQKQRERLRESEDLSVPKSLNDPSIKKISYGNEANMVQPEDIGFGDEPLDPSRPHGPPLE